MIDMSILNRFKWNVFLLFWYRKVKIFAYKKIIHHCKNSKNIFIFKSNFAMEYMCKRGPAKDINATAEFTGVLV